MRPASICTTRSIDPASLSSRTVWLPAGNSGIVRGVTPYDVPPIITCAPAGADVTSSAPILAAVSAPNPGRRAPSSAMRSRAVQTAAPRPSSTRAATGPSAAVQAPAAVKRLTEQQAADSPPDRPKRPSPVGGRTSVPLAALPGRSGAIRSGNGVRRAAGPTGGDRHDRRVSDQPEQHVHHWTESSGRRRIRARMSTPSLNRVGSSANVEASRRTAGSCSGRGSIGEA